MNERRAKLQMLKKEHENSYLLYKKSEERWRKVYAIYLKFLMETNRKERSNE